MKSKTWFVARLALAGALLYYITSRGGNWTAARQLLSAVWLFPFLAIQVLSGMAIESKRMGVLFRAQGIDVPFGYGYRVAAIASFFSVCIPGGTGGDVMKLYYLSVRNPRKRVEIATVLLLDRMVAMVALLSLIVSLALVEGEAVRRYAVIRALVLMAAALAVSLPCFGALCWSARFRGLLARLPFHGFTERVSGAIYAFRDHKSAILRAAGVSLIGHLLLSGVFALAGTVVLPQAPTLLTCVLALCGMLANAVPLTPGGLGVGESAFQALFAMAGFAGGASLMFAWRLCMAVQCLVGCPLYIRGIRQPEPTDHEQAAYAVVGNS